MLGTGPGHHAILESHVRETQYISQWACKKGLYRKAVIRGLNLVENIGRVVAEGYQLIPWETSYNKGMITGMGLTIVENP